MYECDIVFLFDTSGSMGSYISKVKNVVEDFTNDLQNYDVDYRLGIVTFERSVETYEFTDDVDEFKGTVDTILNTGGGYEYGLTAIEEALKMNFRSNVGKYFIMLTDEPYEESSSKSTEIINQLKSNNVRLDVIGLNGAGCNTAYKPVTDATGGGFYDIEGHISKVFQNIIVGANIPSHAFVYNGHSYCIYADVDGVTSWENAKNYCESQGGYLAVINDSAENTALYNYITGQGYKNAYFGLTDSKEEGTWEWSTGDSVNYTNWGSIEPNSERSDEDYAEFYYKYTDGKWNDGNFNHGTINDSSNFICEWDTTKKINNNTSSSGNGNNSTDDGNKNNSGKNYSGVFNESFFELVDSQFFNIATSTSNLVTKLMKKEATTKSSSSTSDENKLLADFKKNVYPNNKFPEDVYKFAMNSIQAVEVEKISIENVNWLVKFISDIFGKKDDGSFTASDGKTYKVTPTLSNISELVTIEVDGESYILSWTGTSAGYTWNSFKNRLVELGEDVCNNVWKELAHDLHSSLTDLWIAALASGGKKEFASVVSEMRNYGDIDVIVRDNAISNIEDLTNKIFPSNSSKIQTLSSEYQTLSDAVTALKNDKNVTTQSTSYRNFVQSYNKLAGDIKTYGGGNISKVYDKTFSSYLIEEIEKSGNTYNYSGGISNISNYSSGEKIEFRSDYAGFDFTDKDFKLKSSSGDLTIKNARDKIIDVSVNENTVAYAYMASGSGEINGSSFSPLEVIVGGNNLANQIIAGSGGSSLWGGSGGNDVLTGGSGQDNFFYGKNDGSDVISNASTNDIVYLYDVSLSDITSAATSGNNISVTFNTGNNLQINSSENLSPTFNLSDGNWKFNHSSGQWQGS